MANCFKEKKPTAAKIDIIIHEERIHKKKKITYKSAIHDLPEDTMIEINSKAYLILANGLYRWSFSGYSKSEMENKTTEKVIVLTPKSYVKTFSKGFTPEVHESI